MRVLKVLSLLLVFTLILASCEKETATISPASDDIFADLGKNGNYDVSLTGDQIDALIMEEIGYVEKDMAKKAELIFEIVDRERSKAFAANNAGGEKSSCLISSNPDFLFTGGNGLSASGVVCEEDLLLNADVFGAFSNGTFFFDGDGEVMNVGVDAIATAFKSRFGPNGATLTFGSVKGSVSTLNAAGNVGTGVVLKQFTRSNLFCDPDDFGDGLRLQAQSRLINIPNGDGEMDYSISLTILCKD